MTIYFFSIMHAFSMYKYSRDHCESRWGVLILNVLIIFTCILYAQYSWDNYGNKCDFSAQQKWKMLKNLFLVAYSWLY